MKISDPVSSLLEHKSNALWQVTPESMVYDAIREMADRDIGALLVMNKGRLVGIVSERDYTREVILMGKSSKKTPVRDIMTRDPVCVRPEDTIADCMQLMTDKRLRHLPVVHDDQVVGIVSIGDAVKWIISAQDSLINQLEHYIKGSYPV